MYTEAIHSAALEFAAKTITEEREAARRELREVRPAIMGAKLYQHPSDPDGTMRQYIVSNALGVSYEHPFDDLPVYQPEDVSPIFVRLLKSTHPCDTYRGHALPSLDELKRLWRWAQWRWAETLRPNIRYRLFRMDDAPGCLDIIVDIRYLIGVMMLTGCEGGEAFYFTDFRSPVLLEAEGAEGVLMPLQTMDFNDCLNDLRYAHELRCWETLNA